MTAPASSKIEGSTPELQGANRFIKLWCQGDFQKTVSTTFDDEIIYRDPFVPSGVLGKTELLKHFARLKLKYKKWDWEDTELFQIGGGFTMRAKVKLTLSNGNVVSDHSLTLGMMDDKGKIRRLEVRYVLVLFFLNFFLFFFLPEFFSFHFLC
jgi:hypothetical protein